MVLRKTRARRMKKRNLGKKTRRKKRRQRKYLGGKKNNFSKSSQNKTKKRRRKRKRRRRTRKRQKGGVIQLEDIAPNIKPNCSNIGNAQAIENNETLSREMKDVLLRVIGHGGIAPVPVNQLTEREKEVYNSTCWGVEPKPWQFQNSDEWRRSYASKLGISNKDALMRDRNENYLLSGPKVLGCLSRNHPNPRGIANILNANHAVPLANCVADMDGDSWVRVFSFKTEANWGPDPYYAFLQGRGGGHVNNDNNVEFDLLVWQNVYEQALGKAEEDVDNKTASLAALNGPTYQQYLERLRQYPEHVTACIPYPQPVGYEPGANNVAGDDGVSRMNENCVKNFLTMLPQFTEEGWKIIFGIAPGGGFPRASWDNPSHKLFVTVEDDLLLRLWERESRNDGKFRCTSRHELHKRLFQLLGLNSGWGAYNRVISFQIQIKNLVRPCQNNLIIKPDGSGGLSESCESIHIGLENNYLKSFKNGNLGDGNLGMAPFTGLGYTYDIGNVNTDNHKVEDVFLDGKVKIVNQHGVQDNNPRQAAPSDNDWQSPGIQGPDEYIVPYGVKIRNPRVYTLTQFVENICTYFNEQENLLPYWIPPDTQNQNWIVKHE